MNNNYIFQPISPDAHVSATFLARCLNEAENTGFTERFTRINDGYTASRFFYAQQNITQLQQYSINDYSENQKITFTLVLIDMIKGYVIDYTPLEETTKTKHI